MKRGQARGISAGLPKFGLHLSEVLTEHVEPLIRPTQLISHLFQCVEGNVQLLARFDTNAHIAKPTPLERVGRQNQ